MTDSQYIFSVAVFCWIVATFVLVVRHRTTDEAALPLKREATEMTDIQNTQLISEYLALVEQAREEAYAAWGDDYEMQKPPHLLVQIVTKQVGLLAAATLEEQNKDFGDAMLAVQEQTVIIGALLANLYALSERHRIDYLDALGELGDE